MLTSSCFRACRKAEWAQDEPVEGAFVKNTYVRVRVVETEQELMVGVAKWGHNSQRQKEDVGHVDDIRC
jgi:hypothetical protein